MAIGGVGLRRALLGAAALVSAFGVVACQTTSSPNANFVLNEGEQFLRDAEAQKNVDLYARAATYFEQTTSAQPQNQRGWLGYGDAKFGVAELSNVNREANYRTAEDAYGRAAELARGADKAEAQFKQAQAAERLSGLGAVQLDPQEPAYLDQAITLYEQSVSQPSAARYFALAGAYRKAGRYRQADEALTRGLGLNPSTAAEAQALVDQAALREQLPDVYSSDDVLASLERARGVDPTSMPVLVKVGEGYLNRAVASGSNNFSEARDAFADATGASRENRTVEGVDYLAEAYYYLSVIDTIDPAASRTALNSAVENADRAVAEGSEARYRRQQCLAHIKRAGVSVTEGLIEQRCQGGGGAEGALLRGMSKLRLAQHHRPGATKLNYLRGAREDFRNGRDLASGASLSERSFQWPGMPGPLPYEAVLGFGQEIIVDQCSPDPRNTRYTPEGVELTTLRDFYRRYNAFACSA